MRPPPHAVSISRHLGLPFGRVSHKQNNTHTHTHTLTHTHHACDQENKRSNGRINLTSDVNCRERNESVCPGACVSVCVCGRVCLGERQNKQGAVKCSHRLYRGFGAISPLPALPPLLPLLTATTLSHSLATIYCKTNIVDSLDHLLSLKR